MRHIIFNLPERPAFMKIVEIDRHFYNGYTLQIDIDNPSESIINLNKRRGKTMLVPERVAIDESWEEIFNSVKKRRENFDKDLEEAKAQAIAEVERKYEHDRLVLEEMYIGSSREIQVEVPDEEEVVEEPTEEQN